MPRPSSDGDTPSTSGSHRPIALSERRAVTPHPREDDPVDRTLRPTRFGEFTGQRRVVDNLRTWIGAAKREARPVDHILLTGPPGLGKTTLAHLVANELGAKLVPTSGPSIERPGDLAGILSKLGRGDIFFIDEVHRLRANVEEFLYGAMEDFRIDVGIDEGPMARTVRVGLERFTLIAATTRSGLLSKPFRDRFGVQERLEPYPPDDLVEIALRSSRVLGCSLEKGAARVLSERARGTPRVVNRFLARVRDVASVEGASRIDDAVASRALAMLGVDEDGLDEIDRRILRAIAAHGGHPVGLKTIAVAVDEEEDTIEEVYEPFLIQRGLVTKTPRGRILSNEGFAKAGVAAPARLDPDALQRGLF